MNPSQLRTAEMKALTTSTAKNGGIYLLNKVVEMVFKKEELLTSKGVKGLDQHKLEAIQGISYILQTTQLFTFTKIRINPRFLFQNTDCPSEIVSCAFALKLNLLM